MRRKGCGGARQKLAVKANKLRTCEGSYRVLEGSKLWYLIGCSAAGGFRAQPIRQRCRKNSRRSAFNRHQNGCPVFSQDRDPEADAEHRRNKEYAPLVKAMAMLLPNIAHRRAGKPDLGGYICHPVAQIAGISCLERHIRCRTPSQPPTSAAVMQARPFDSVARSSP